MRPPPSAAERLTDAARDLNEATHFGRMDIAVDLTGQEQRQDFAQRRAEWGYNVRIISVDFAGVDMADQETADVLVTLAWTRMDEGTLRSTQIRQTWKDEAGPGWVLVAEKRVAGDLGLFGEQTDDEPFEPSQDVHFPTKTIR